MTKPKCPNCGSENTLFKRGYGAQFKFNEGERVCMDCGELID